MPLKGISLLAGLCLDPLQSSFSETFKSHLQQLSMGLIKSPNLLPRQGLKERNHEELRPRKSTVFQQILFKPKALRLKETCFVIAFSTK